MINVAFVGALYIPKGLLYLYDMINDKDLPVNWHLIGWITHQFRKELSNNAYSHNGYHSLLELYDVLDYHDIDLVIMPGECPESFSYVLSEIWNYGLPVLVSDRGALQTRMEECNEQNGWICDPRYMGDKLIYLNEHFDEVIEKQNNLLTYKVKTVEEMCNDYRSLYNKYLFID